MRVALVSPFDPSPGGDSPSAAHRGGVERSLEETATRLANRGHDVTLISSTSGKRRRSQEGRLARVREPRRFVVLRAPYARLARHVPSDADVVHVPATYPFTTVPVMRRAKQLGIPTVLDYHFDPASGSLAYHWLADLYLARARRTFRTADRVLVRSLEYARGARGISSVPASRIRAVPNGVAIERFHPNGAGLSGEYLLFVGRLVPYKGVDTLLRALALMKRPPPLVVAGDGPLRERLQRQAKAFHLQVDFRGHVSDEELPGLYRAARATVLPSVTRQEAFGMALLESLACGTPVLASDLPGVADVAREGGAVAPPRDETAWAALLTSAWETDALPRGHALARSIAGRYGWDPVIDRLETVYEEAAARAGKGA